MCFSVNQLDDLLSIIIKSSHRNSVFCELRAFIAYLPSNNLKALFSTSTFMANVLSIMDIAPKHGNAVKTILAFSTRSVSQLSFHEI